MALHVRLNRSLILALLLLAPVVYADDTDPPSTTLTVAPAAASGTLITAADVNSRSNTMSTWANAHVHALPAISGSTANSFAVGDALAGNKSFCANAANATDSCIRFNDTTKTWTLDNPAGTFNQVATLSGTSGLIANSIVIADGTSSLRSFLMTNCPDSGGNHLNYTASTNAWSCGTSSSGGLETGTWTSIGGSRAMDTVYQNTSGVKRRVAISAYSLSGENTCKLLVGSANPPTLVAGYVGAFTGNTVTLAFELYAEVPNNWYYKVLTVAGAPGFNFWLELDE